MSQLTTLQNKIDKLQDLLNKLKSEGIEKTKIISWHGRFGEDVCKRVAEWGIPEQRMKYYFQAASAIIRVRQEYGWTPKRGRKVTPTDKKEYEEMIELLDQVFPQRNTAPATVDRSDC
jgi:hypothetical protein